MRKIFLSLLILTSSLLSASAGEVRLGYCNGKVNTSSAVGASGRTWVETAIYIPAKLLGSYSGNSITQVGAGLAAKLNIDTLRVWVRSELSGENISQGEILKSDLVRGWNNVTLSSPYVITGTEEGLYVGYSYKQRGSSTVYGISYVDGLMENSFYAKLGTDVEWKDMSQTGILSIEAVVSGDNLFAHDVGISSQTAKAGAANGEVSFTATFTNYGTQSVESIDLLAYTASSTEKAATHLEIAIAPGASKDTTFTIGGLPSGAGLSELIYMSVEKVNGEADENASNDNVSVPYEQKRKVMIEEFTAESCSNCPRMANLLHSMLHSDDYKDNMIVACHHSGFATDWLTKRPADTEYTVFYTGGSMFAPAAMFDRYPFFTDNGKDTPLSTLDEETFRACMAARLAQPTYTRLNIAARYVTDDSLSVTVTGHRAKQFCDTPARVTLYLLEDSITPRHQLGASEGFMHMHVERVINSTWGEVIDWQDDGSFSYTYGMTLSDGWKRQHLQLVTFVSGYDSTDPLNCVIENAESLALSDISTTGIREVKTTDAKVLREELYTPGGTRVGTAGSTRGLMIKRTVYADGTSKTEKVIAH